MRFSALDAFRGICAVLVALFHVRLQSDLNGQFLVHNAFLLVDFFFVLSGFVMVEAYGRQLDTPREAMAFLLRRFGRLYPLHLFTLGCMVAIALGALLTQYLTGIPLSRAVFEGRQSLPSLATNLAMLQAYGLHDGLTWNAPGWSIAAEFFAYVLFAIVLLFPRRFLAPLAGALVLGSGLILFIRSPAYLAGSYDFGFLRAVCGFFAGVIAWHVSHRFGAALDGRRLTGTLLEILFVALVCLFVARAGTSIWTMTGPLLYGLTVALFSREAGFVSAALRRPSLERLGAWSYSIYMIHYSVVTLLKTIVEFSEKRWGMDMTSPLPGIPEPGLISFGDHWLMDGVSVAYVGVVIFFAWLTYRHVEQPARRYVNSLTNPPITPPPSQAPATSP